MLSVLFFVCAFQKVGQGMQEMIKVEYVLLDVLATDRAGQPVSDLSAADFIIKEGRKMVDFTLVDSLDLTSPGETLQDGLTQIPQVTAAEEEKSQPYQMILALDLFSLNPTEKAQVGRQLANFIPKLAEQGNPHVYIYSLDKGNITSGFTSDLAKAAEQMAQHTAQLRDEGVSKQYVRHNPGFQDLEAYLKQCKSANIPGHSRDTAWQKRLSDCISAELDVFVDKEVDELQRVVRELEGLTLKFAENKGPKFIYFISPGFSLNPGREASELANQYMVGHAPLGREASFRNEFRRIYHACIRNRVVFNTFDIFNTEMVNKRIFSPQFDRAGGAVEKTWRGYRRSLENGLISLAEESGGRSHSGLNLVPVMLETYQRTRHIYVLGYASPKGKKGKYRKIKVSCKRSGVKLEYRKGYFGL